MKTPIVATVALLMLCQLAFALAEEQFGPDKPGHPTTTQPGWPKGIEQLPRHSSRVYSIWVNGNENFYFKATPTGINELLELFSRSRLRDHQVDLKFAASAPKVPSIDKREFEYNVSLKVLSGIALFVTREDNDDQTLEPVLTIYLADGGESLKQIKLPDNSIITTSRDVPEVKAKRNLPKRQAWYGKIQSDNAATMPIETGVQTRITLWEKDVPDGIELAHIPREGLFKIVLSDAEIASMREGRLWVTVTAGNFLTTARSNDKRFPVDLLTQDKNKAQPFKLAPPPYYYGRLLFEDGTPPIIDKKPWPGAEIFVDFPYAGVARPDAQGYFRVCFDRAQFDQLIEQKSRKNIYVPEKQSGSSTARAVFPPTLLSTDKSKAGVVKIPKPAYGPGA